MQSIECSPKYAEKRFDMNHSIDTEVGRSGCVQKDARPGDAAKVMKRMVYPKGGGVTQHSACWSLRKKQK